MAPCALCKHEDELRDSHIIPKFVFDYLKKTSATGFLRFSNEPNRRVQDGRKVPLLCGTCEQRFSSAEKYFAETIFQPYNADRAVVVTYDSRVLYFAVSLSWRVLYFYNARAQLGHIPERHWPALDRALETWRLYLLGELPHPGRFDQHILPMDELTEATGPKLPPHFNRYVLRAVDMDVVAGDRTALVYTKVPRIAIVGTVTMPEPRNSWQGTRIPVRRGILKPRSVIAPGAFGDYMMAKAKLYGESLENMSDRQKAVVEDAALRDLDRTASSESFRAIAADVRMFGRAAFAPATDSDERLPSDCDGTAG